MPLIIPASGAKVAAAYSVDNSCRFDGTSAKLDKSLGTATDIDKFTWSFWVKRGLLGIDDGNYRNVVRCHSSSTVYTACNFTSSDTMEFGNRQGAGAGGHKGRLITTRKFSDPAAWYNFVCVWDSGNGTAGDRMKMYVNGVEETSFSTDTNPVSDEDSGMASGNTHDIGVHESSYWYDGYMAEVCLVDGQALGPTSFGEFDSDSPTIWKPIDVSGLTFGDNGFYLDFEASDNLGNDANGGTDFTETNIAAVDQCTDSPTNNFTTLNHVAWPDIGSGVTFSEGNCKIVNSTADWRPIVSTIVPTNGKWVCEVKVTDIGDDSKYGIMDYLQYDGAGNFFWNIKTGSRAWTYAGSDGDYNNSGSETSYGDSFTTDDIIGIYMDLDNNKLYFSKNGTVQNSGTGISITDGYDYAFAFNPDNADFEANFGNPTYANSSSVADPNGYGDFEYSTTITGDSASKAFYALCTKNLAEFG